MDDGPNAATLKCSLAFAYLKSDLHLDLIDLAKTIDR